MLQCEQGSSQQITGICTRSAGCCKGRQQSLRKTSSSGFHTLHTSGVPTGKLPWCWTNHSVACRRALPYTGCVSETGDWETISNLPDQGVQADASCNLNSSVLNTEISHYRICYPAVAVAAVAAEAAAVALEVVAAASACFDSADVAVSAVALKLVQQGFVAVRTMWPGQNCSYASVIQVDLYRDLQSGSSPPHQALAHHLCNTPLMHNMLISSCPLLLEQQSSQGYLSS